MISSVEKKDVEIQPELTAREKYNLLIDQLIKYENQYYNSELVDLTDAEFDSLYYEAQFIEQNHKDWIREDSPTKRVMGSINTTDKEVTHKIPCLSLAKAMNFDELQKWLKNLNNFGINEFFVESKHDGLACVLRYSQGRFIQAATRGNGLVGKDVTKICWQIDSIPKIIDYKKDLEVRGEIFLTKSGLEKINEYIKKYSPRELIKKNVRNTASGLLNDKNPSIEKSKYLQFAAYMSLDNECVNHKASMLFLKELGFKITNDFVNNFIINFYGKDFNTLMTKLKKKLNDINDMRDSLDFEIDGLVIKVNYYAEQKKLGNKQTVPNWAVAYKFPQEEKVSILKDIRWDLGSKGTLTPVAIIETVNILGADVSNVTLHNIEEINRLNIKIGDHITVTRRGDVIPKIINVLTDLRTGNEQDIIIPEICPICKEKLKFEEVYIRCDNDKCKGRIVGKIVDFVTKLDIKDFGEKLITALVNRNVLNSIADIYYLKANDISVLDKQGTVSANKVIDHINKSRQAPLAKIISGLGIANIGEMAGKDLAKFYKSLSNFKNAKYQELTSINNIGSTVASNIINWINQNNDLLDQLINLNLGIDLSNNQGKLANKTFAFTGALSISRKKFQELIEENGGINSSIKQGLNYLIIGNGAKQPKIDKAKKYNAQIITEQDFNNLL